MSAWGWLDWPIILWYSGIALVIIIEIVTRGRDG